MEAESIFLHLTTLNDPSHPKGKKGCTMCKIISERFSFKSGDCFLNCFYASLNKKPTA